MYKVYYCEFESLPPIYQVEGNYYPVGKFRTYLTQNELDNFRAFDDKCKIKILKEFTLKEMEQKTTKKQTIKWIIIALVIGLVIVAIRIAINVLTKGK